MPWSTLVEGDEQPQLTIWVNSSVTRFAKFSPLWQNEYLFFPSFEVLGKLWSVLFMEHFSRRRWTTILARSVSYSVHEGKLFLFQLWVYNFDLLQGQYGCSSAATKVLHADAYYSIAFAGTDWRKISVTNSTAESFREILFRNSVTRFGEILSLWCLWSFMMFHLVLGTILNLLLQIVYGNGQIIFVTNGQILCK